MKTLLAQANARHEERVLRLCAVLAERFAGGSLRVERTDKEWLVTIGADREGFDFDGAGDTLLTACCNAIEYMSIYERRAFHTIVELMPDLRPAHPALRFFEPPEGEDEAGYEISGYVRKAGLEGALIASSFGLPAWIEPAAEGEVGLTVQTLQLPGREPLDDADYRRAIGFRRRRRSKRRTARGGREDPEPETRAAGVLPEVPPCECSPDCKCIPMFYQNRFVGYTAKTLEECAEVARGMGLPVMSRPADANRLVMISAVGNGPAGVDDAYDRAEARQRDAQLPPEALEPYDTTDAGADRPAERSE